MGLIFVLLLLVIAVAGGLSLRSMVRDRGWIERAVRAPTWSELTRGELTAERQGPLLTFWASGRPSGRLSRTTVPDVFVAVDEGTLVAVQPQPWPRSPMVRWLVRTDDGPHLVVRKGWWGPIIAEQDSGLLLQRPNHTCEEVARDLRRRGWLVRDLAGDPDDDRSPDPSGPS